MPESKLPNLMEQRERPIRLRFVIQRQVVIGDVKIELTPTTGTPVSEDELRARLNLLQPGTRFSKQIIIRHTQYRSRFPAGPRLL